MYSTNLGTFDLLSKRGLRSSHEEVEYWIPYRNPVSCARKAAPEKLSFFAYDEQVRERLVSTRITRSVNEETSRRSHILAWHRPIMAVDFKSILRVVFIGLSVVIIASNRVIARPQRGDLEFLPVENYDCSSMRKDDRSSDKGNHETRFVFQEYYFLWRILNR